MFDQLEAFILGMLQTIFDLGGWWGVAGVMALENATGITPSEVILGFAGWMLISGHELPVSMIFLGGLYAMVGSVAGASIAYWAARLGGRPLVDRLARLLRIEDRLICKAEEQFQRYGAWCVLIGRMIPGIRTLISLPAGLARMPYGLFLANTAIGAYLWCTLLIGVGYFLGHEWHLIREVVRQAAPFLMALGVVFLFSIWLWRRRRASSENRSRYSKEVTRTPSTEG